MKRQNQLNIKRGLLSKLVLLVALFLGSSNAWGQDTPVTESFEYATDGENPIAINSGNMSLTNEWCVVGSGGIGSNYLYKLRLNTISSNSRTGNNSIFATANTDNWIVCPVQISGTLSFYAKRYDSSGYIKVGIATKTNDEFTITNESFSYTEIGSSDYTGKFGEISVNLGNSPVYVAFFVYNGYMDDVTYTPYVDESDTPQPTVFSSSVTAYNSVNLSWTAGGEETEWQIKYNEGSDFTPAEAGTLIDHDAITTNPYTLSGLSGNTTYYAYIRAYVDAETQSEWTGPLSFTTYEQYPTPTNFAISSHDASTATFTWNNGLGTTPTSWELKYSTDANFNPDSEGTQQSVGENPPYTLENLTENVTYFAYLRAYYSADDKYSNWTEKLMFVPTTADFVLDENNVTSISTISSKKVLLKYRPSNGWNTMCMPFPPNSYMTTIFGSGYKAYALKSYSSGILTFEKASYIGASTPYVVYSESVPDNPNGVVLTGVTIYSGGLSPSSTTKGGATLQGTFASKYFVEGDNWYGLTTAGKVMKAGEGAYVKGYRAYFTGVTPPESSARISIVFEGEDDGETTDLGFVRMVDPEAKDIFTLSGQKVEKAGKGIYIVNGRKVVIK